MDKELEGELNEVLNEDGVLIFKSGYKTGYQLGFEEGKMYLCNQLVNIILDLKKE